MGEAKRKRRGPCPCGSQRIAVDCCLRDGRWWKAPATIRLNSGGYEGSHAKCYLRDTRSCSDVISGEHLISENALRVLDDTGICIGGFPWMGKDEVKQIGFSGLTANRLCKSHNNALSSLDAAAGRFFRAIKDCDVKADEGPQHHLMSGHDIERWF